MVSVRIKGLASGNRKIRTIVHTTALNEMDASMKDLQRVTADTVPYDKGDLELGGSNLTMKAGKKYIGQVGFNAYNKDFNYAIWIHEEDYNLGVKSLAKPDAVGKSGNTYKVDKKYLTRTHEGEAPYYREQFEKKISQALRSVK